jgi:hypothetical protein
LRRLGLGPDPHVPYHNAGRVDNQMDLSQVVFGNWEDDIFGMWGGLDIVIDPYTSAQTASVNVTTNAFADNAVRHTASFAWSTDSGAQ